MNKSVPFTDKWHGFCACDFAIFIYVFFLINTVKVSGSKPACILDVGTSSSFNNTSCAGGKWGGFLNENCSGVEFCDYLYALSLRANRTGKIFLNPEEQRNCSGKKEKTDEADVSGCGMEKLKGGGGGCLDFSTMDVKTELGYKLEKLKGNCRTTPADGWNESCSSCLRSWEEIKEMHSERGRSPEVDSEICSFAVLVTLVSTEIENEMWARKIFSCIGNEHIGEDSEVSEYTEKKKIRPGLCMLIGGVVGVVVVLIFSILILSHRRETPIAPVDKDAWRPAPSNSPSWKPALSAVVNDSAILKVSIEDVHAATNNLCESNLIGEGTAGKVYRGVLSDNHRIAIKQITNGGCADTFLREIRSLVRVRHPNLVALVGFCENGSECFLIYELCPNGNLSDWLYGEDKALSWVQRLEIAIGSARGLRFLHTFPEGCIVHRDVKPTNILLGTDFEARLSDFGLSKVMNLGESSISSEVRGTFGYVDPEYQTDHHISAASDIYSFGIVLLQILSGRKVIDMNMKKPKPLDKIAKYVMKAGKTVEFADQNLHGEYSMDAFLLVFELALSCTGQKQQRPSIREVMVKLEEALSLTMRMEASRPHATPDWSKVP